MKIWTGVFLKIVTENIMNCINKVSFINCIEIYYIKYFIVLKNSQAVRS